VRYAMASGRSRDPPHLHAAPVYVGRVPPRTGANRRRTRQTGGSAMRWISDASRTRPTFIPLRRVRYAMASGGSRNPPHLHSAPTGPLRDGIGPARGTRPTFIPLRRVRYAMASGPSRDPPHLRRPGSVVRTGSAARRTRHSPETVDQLLHRPDVRSAERVVES